MRQLRVTWYQMLYMVGIREARYQLLNTYHLYSFIPTDSIFSCVLLFSIEMWVQEHVSGMKKNM